MVYKHNKNIYEFIFVALILFCFSTGNANEFKHKKNYIDINIKSEMKNADYLSLLTKDNLQKLFPEIKNPRIMTVNDIKDKFEKRAVKLYNFSFFIIGEFNNDGFIEIVFTGKYDEPEDGYADLFLGIISVQRDKMFRDFFERLYYGPSYAQKPKGQYLKKSSVKNKSDLDSVFICYTAAPSDWCEILSWNGKEYKYGPPLYPE